MGSSSAKVGLVSVSRVAFVSNVFVLGCSELGCHFVKEVRHLFAIATCIVHVDFVVKYV